MHAQGLQSLGVIYSVIVWQTFLSANQGHFSADKNACPTHFIVVLTFA
jgi:hypothetical protein